MTYVERYSRNIILREIGGAGQKRLSLSKVLVIGAGGLGVPVLLYLTSSGVGKIGIIDADKVSLSNLQRQVIYGSRDIGERKVKIAKKKLSELNPDTVIREYSYNLTFQNAEKIITDYDLIVDGSDDLKVRYLVNKCCIKLRKPFLSGGLSQWDGYVSLYYPFKGSSCFECLFPESEATFSSRSVCADLGVYGPLAGVIGGIMASESLKFLAQAGTSLANEMIIFDALNGQMRRFETTKRKNCKCCGIKKNSI